MKIQRAAVFIVATFALVCDAASCRGNGYAAAAESRAQIVPAKSAGAAPRRVPEAVDRALSASLPEKASREVRVLIESSPSRFAELLAAATADRDADPIMLAPIDKERALSEGYEPGDLVALDGTGLSLSRPDHRLARPAFEAMKAMNAAARSEGVTLLVSSAYRSYQYQVEVFGRHAREMGREAALKVSAEPGHSQHQLGTAIDFGSITEAFAMTAASRWLEANAARFGFSLSFPKGMTEITGYDWEPWHYRFVGRAVAALQAEFFGGVQLYVLRFLEAYCP